MILYLCDSNLLSMIVKTKKYQLTSSKYIGLALKALIKKEWKYFGIPALLLILGFVFPSAFWWFFTFALLVPGLYILFWVVQFAGFTQHESGKMFFYKMSFEIDSKQVMLKMDSKHGMPVEYKSFTNAFKTKDAFILTMSKAQFIYLPFSIFKSDGDKKMTETILKRKKLL
ncbi:MAG: hypothetical protein ACJA0Q_000680 [Saprospiraceae bacterium]|jgi:hypothetical protein